MGQIRSRPTMPLQEEGKGVGGMIVGSNRSPKYGATIDNPPPSDNSRGNAGSIQGPRTVTTPVQAISAGTDDQNQLVVTKDPPHYRILANTPKIPVRTILCRFLAGIFVLIFLLISLGFLIYTIVSRQDESGGKTVNHYTTVLLEETNSFWYKRVGVLKDKTALYDVHVGIVDCDELTYDSQNFSEFHNGHKASRDGYWQLEYLEPYSYLVEGSQVELVINITSPPTDKGKNVSLLYFSSYKEYSKLEANSDARLKYDEKIDLNCTNGDNINRIAFSISQTGYMFFAMSTPNGTDFTYNFTVHQVSFNDSMVDFWMCQLAGDQTSCQLELNITKNTKSRECVMAQCIVAEGISPQFYQVSFSFNRRYINWVSCTLMAVLASFVLVLLAIGSYDCIREKVYPSVKRSVSSFFRKLG